MFRGPRATPRVPVYPNERSCLMLRSRVLGWRPDKAKQINIFFKVDSYYCFRLIVIRFLYFKYNFIYLWLCWVFPGAQGLSLVAESEGYSSSQTLEHVDFSSCNTKAWLFHSTWNLPGPGTEYMSSALAGRFLSSAPPGKSSCYQNCNIHVPRL